MKSVDIFEAIESAIARNELQPGERLPAVREAATLWSVNKNTVTAAYRRLQDAGLVVTSGRNGSTVARRARGVQASSPVPDRKGTILLHNGSPDRTLLPDEATLRGHLLKVRAGQRTYAESRNSEALIDWANASFDGDRVPTGQSLIGSGALDLMSWAVRTSLKVGDRVGIEDPGYATSAHLLRSLGMRTVGITLDADGLVPQSLERAIARGCKAVVLSSRAQNPTGACTTPRRAAQLAAVIRSAPDTLFIDDDHSSMLQLAPYQNFVATSARRWIVIRSLSKFLGPDLRVSVCRGDKTTVGRIEAAQSLAMGWVSLLLQDLAGRLLRDKAVTSLVSKAGQAYRQRFLAMQASLRDLGLSTIGHAGLNIWVPCPDEAAVCARLLGMGWRVRPGFDFVAGSAPGFRVTCAALDDKSREAFVAALRVALDDVPAQTA